jgi:predicted DNA-binding protein
MARTGRPKGDNNKEHVYSLRMEEAMWKRLEAYCKLTKKTKSEALRDAIDELTTTEEENNKNE